MTLKETALAEYERARRRADAEITGSDMTFGQAYAAMEAAIKEAEATYARTMRAASEDRADADIE